MFLTIKKCKRCGKEHSRSMNAKFCTFECYLKYSSEHNDYRKTTLSPEDRQARVEAKIRKPSYTKAIQKRYNIKVIKIEAKKAEPRVATQEDRCRIIARDIQKIMSLMKRGNIIHVDITEQWRMEDNWREALCYYCGEDATDREHVIPRCVSGELTIKVPACRECNVLLGSSVQPSLVARGRALHLILSKRYERLLRYEIRDDMIRDTRGRLRGALLSARRKQEEARRRIQVSARFRFMDDPSKMRRQPQ